MTHRLRLVLGLAVGFLLLWTLPAVGQNVPPHNLPAFEPVDFPDPNEYRAADGRPGYEYWQQQADYQIDVTLDPEHNRVSATQTITYTNNAPEALDRLWVQLEQNFFKPGSRGASAVPQGARFSGFFEDAGYDLSRVRLVRNGETIVPDTVVDGTRMRISLAEPLAANGGSLQIQLDWSFTLPQYGADRHGRLDVAQGTVYQLAQWYPRMYVYDDVHGWNPLPYLGQGEYYLEFGTFEINITVPRDFIVAATGTLQNPGEVLTQTQRNRLERARESRETVMIIDSTEVGDPSTRPDGEGPLTWRYRAEDVRDFAWSASQAFIWDAARADAGDRTVLAQSFYPKEGLGSGTTPGWEESTRYVQHSVEFYSDFVSPYPYPTAINVAGVVAGMEYPQIVFCDVESRGRGLFGVTDHEFGHTWFPMVVASDERRWAWMDEGLNTFINQYSTAAFYDRPSRQSLQRLARGIPRFMRSGYADQPIMTYADRIRSQALGPLAYSKPAYGLMLLREYVVGPELFDSAFEAYVDRWAYKHPKPADFFRTLEDVTGEDLDWFWRSWFYENDTVDQAVASVTMSDTTQTTRVTLEQRSEFILPMTVRLTYGDGSSEQRRIPPEAFYTKDTHTLALSGRPLQKVTLDPAQILPDMNRPNNTWSASEASSSDDPSSSQQE